MASSDSAYSLVKVVGLWEGQSLEGQAAEVVRAASLPEYTSEPGGLAEAFSPDGGRTLVVSLGPEDAKPGPAFRKGIARAWRRAQKVKAERASLILPDSASSAHAEAAGEVAGMLAWDGGIYKSRPSAPSPGWEAAEPLAEAFQKGLDVAAAVNRARTLAATSPSEATPAFMAERAREVAESSGLQWSVIQGEGLVEERLAGLEAVGRASANPPCLIRLEWNPGGSDEAPVVLVGKTVTFDTGGLSIKDKKGMPGMKGDKAGGCAVLAAMEILAKVLKPSHRVVALLPAAENSISGSAYRPDDVLTFRNGTSVEVTNTDAEGRLVLADALCWACEVEKARAVVDIATLTGGVVIALGGVFAGLFASEASLADSLREAGQDCGERLWPLPLDGEYQEMMKSEVADLVNSNLNGKAHPVQGATFLSRFVLPGVAWAHLDIAGVSHASSPTGILPAGPTGFGARLLARWAAGQVPE